MESVRRLPSSAAACAGSTALLLASCLIPGGDGACGKNQVEVDEPGVHYCACAPGFVIDDDGRGCRACAENETSDANTCVCKLGYARPSASAPCSMIELGACDSSSGCGADFPVCVMDGADSYCTREGCGGSNDCPPTWYCDQGTDGNLCKRPPAGYRQACEGPDDCAGTAATYCDSFQTHSCLIQGCGKGAPCPGDWSCCDISLIGITLCIEPSGLTAGACPAGGSLVEP